RVAPAGSSLPALIAVLPVIRAIVCVGPPLYCSGPSLGSSVRLITAPGTPVLLSTRLLLPVMLGAVPPPLVVATKSLPVLESATMVLVLVRVAVLPVPPLIPNSPAPGALPPGPPDPPVPPAPAVTLLSARVLLSRLTLPL